MIVFYVSRWPLTDALVYLLFYLPVQYIRGALLSIVGLILCSYHHPFEFSGPPMEVDSNKSCLIDLPMTRFGDLKSSEGSKTEGCSVCLVEFESEGMVSKLSQCGHVFHIVCIRKWVRRNHFTCPLCRSSLLSVYGGEFHESHQGISG